MRALDPSWTKPTQQMMLRLLNVVETRDDEVTQATDRAAGITSINCNGGSYELYTCMVFHGM